MSRYRFNEKPLDQAARGFRSAAQGFQNTFVRGAQTLGKIAARRLKRRRKK